MMNMDRLKAMKESARLKKVMRPKVIIPVVAGTAVVGMLCFGHGTVSASPVVSDTAEVRSLVNYCTFTGNIEACNDVTVVPAVSAAVREVYHQEGDEVKAGDVRSFGMVKDKGRISTYLVTRPFIGRNGGNVCQVKYWKCVIL